MGGWVLYPLPPFLHFLIKFTVDWWLFFGETFWFFPQKTDFLVKKFNKTESPKMILPPLFKELWAIVILVVPSKYTRTFRVCGLFEKHHQSSLFLTQIQIHDRMMALFFTFLIKFTIVYWIFWENFGYFSPRKRIIWSRRSKKLKVQKWCHIGFNSII